jgi:cell division protein FtsB
MDPATIAIMSGAAISAISALFWQLMKAKDEQITALKADNAALKDEVRKLNDVVVRNTAALESNATAQTSVVTMLQDLLGPPSTSSTPQASR